MSYQDQASLPTDWVPLAGSLSGMRGTAPLIESSAVRWSRDTGTAGGIWASSQQMAAEGLTCCCGCVGCQNHRRRERFFLGHRQALGLGLEPRPGPRLPQANSSNITPSPVQTISVLSVCSDCQHPKFERDDDDDDDSRQPPSTPVSSPCLTHLVLSTHPSSRRSSGVGPAPSSPPRDWSSSTSPNDF